MSDTPEPLDKARLIVLRDMLDALHTELLAEQDAWPEDQRDYGDAVAIDGAASIVNLRIGLRIKEPSR